MAWSYVGVGSTGAGTGSVTVGLPSGIQADDILLLFIEGEGENYVPDFPPTGGDWTGLDNFAPGNPSPSAASATTGELDKTRHSVYYHIYDGTNSPALSVPDAGNHTLARIAAFRGVDTSDPIAGWRASGSGTNNTSISIPGFHTDVDGCMIVATTTAGDNVTISSWANSNLASITGVSSVNTTSGSDGTHGFAYGILTSAGDIGTTTATSSANEEEASFCIALRPDGVASDEPTVTPLLNEGSSSNGTSFVTDSASFTAGEEYLLGIYAVSSSVNDNTEPTVSGGGQTWGTPIVSEVSSHGYDGYDSYIRWTVFKVTAASGSGALTISFTDTQDIILWSLVKVNGGTAGTPDSGDYSTADSADFSSAITNVGATDRTLIFSAWASQSTAVPLYLSPQAGFRNLTMRMKAGIGYGAAMSTQISVLDGAASGGVSVNSGYAGALSFIAIPIEAAAGGDTNVSASAEALTLTTQQATVTSDVNVSAAAEALTLTEYPATIAYGVDIAASTEALTLTTNQAAVSLDVNVPAAAESLTITEYAATVSLDIDISANQEALSLATYAVEIVSDVEIAANAASITLTEYPATVTHNINVQASAEALTLTPNAATVTASVDTNVSASAAALTITEYTASVVLDHNIAANAESLQFTTLSATVSTVSDVDVEAGTASLALATHQAGVALDVDIAASAEVLTLIANPASVSIDTEISAAAEALTLTEYPASIGYDVEIVCNAESLELSTLSATIGTTADVNVEANAEVLTLTPLAAEIGFVRTRRGGDDAPGMRYGDAKRFFYEKQIRELEGRVTARRIPRKKKAKRVREAFEPFQRVAPEAPHEDAREALRRLERLEITERQFKEAMQAYVAAVRAELQQIAEANERIRRKRNNEAVIALLMVA